MSENTTTKPGLEAELHEWADAWATSGKSQMVDAMREAADEIARLAAERNALRRVEKLARNLLAVSRAVGVLGATEISDAEEALDRALNAEATP